MIRFKHECLAVGSDAYRCGDPVMFSAEIKALINGTYADYIRDLPFLY